MSDGLAAVMSRISQIRAAMGGGGGVLGVTNTSSSGQQFDSYLKAASGADSSSSSSPSAWSNPTADPMERVAVRNATAPSAKSTAGKAAGASSVGGTSAEDWPADAPEGAEQFKDEFIAASQATGVPLRILLAVTWAESAFNPAATSGVGAQGLMQLMPGTAAGLGVDASDPAQNIMGGARYLAAQYAEFGSWDLAFAAYNAGPGAVQQYGGIPPYRETQSYVSIINGYLDRLGDSVEPSAAGLGTAGAGIAGAGIAGPTPAVNPASGVTALQAQALAATVAAGAQANVVNTGAGTDVALDPAKVVSPVLEVRTAAGPLDATPLGGLDVAAAAAAATVNGSAGGGADTSTATITTNAAALPDRLVALLQRTQQDGTSGHRLTIRLDPPELGNVHVTFELRGDQVHMVVRPDRPEGGQLLADQRDRIASALAGAGFELSGFDVSAGGGQSDQSTCQAFVAGRAYRSADIEPNTDVLLTVDRELRL